MDFNSVSAVIEEGREQVSIVDIEAGNKGFRVYIDKQTPARRFVVDVKRCGSGFWFDVHSLAGWDAERQTWGDLGSYHTISERLESRKGEKRCRQLLAEICAGHREYYTAGSGRTYYV